MLQNDFTKTNLYKARKQSKKSRKVNWLNNDIDTKNIFVLDNFEPMKKLKVWKVKSTILS